MTDTEVADNRYGIKWAKSVMNDSRYYKADCLYHLFHDKEALALMEEHLAHRRKGIESDFSKKEGTLFYKILKYSRPREISRVSDDGYASKSQKKRCLKRIEELGNGTDLNKLIRYLKVISKHYPKEYYLKTIMSEYCKKTEDKEGCLTYAIEAFKQEPNDPLVTYDYAEALLFNNLFDDALVQFEGIMDWGIDYIAYSEHREGVRWAKKILRDTQYNIKKIRTHLNI